MDEAKYEWICIKTNLSIVKDLYNINITVSGNILTDKPPQPRIKLIIVPTGKAPAIPSIESTPSQ